MGLFKISIATVFAKVTKKRNHQLDNSSVVDYSEKLSNLMEDLKKVEEFINSSKKNH